mgnify:FL=1|jgi:hypothetical protein
MKNVTLNYTVINDSGEIKHHKDVLPVKQKDGKFEVCNHSFTSFEAVQAFVSLLVNTTIKPATYSFK